MSDSILQVNQIKDKGGNNTGITIADSTANISIGTTLAVNTINEVTSANGVTIDGLSLKDGNVVPAAGKGIDFSNQSLSGAGNVSETLDHYESGTYSPAITADGGAPSGISATRDGKYTRIGNVVHVSIHLAYSSWVSGPSGDVYVTLPFNVGSYAGGAAIGYIHNFDVGPVKGRTATNSNKVYLYVANDADVVNSTNYSSVIQGSQINSNSRIYLSVTYHVD